MNEYEKLKKNLEFVSSEIDKAVADVEMCEFKVKVDLACDVAKTLFTDLASESSLSISECCDKAVSWAWIFAEKMNESIKTRVSKMDGYKPLKNEIATEIVNKLSDEFIVDEVGQRGLVADVVFANEGLVESYGFVRKNDDI